MSTYVVTNRSFDENQSGLKQFTMYTSAEGPNELRLVRITKTRRDYRAQLLGDKLSKDEVKNLKKDFSLDIDETADWYASLSVACWIFRQATKEARHVLLLVHGYNNDLKDVLDTVSELEKAYPVIVVVFSWPANGGGAVTGKLAYLEDKRDARASSDALNRVIGKIGEYFQMLTEAQRTNLMKKAIAKHPDNPTMQRMYFSELLSKHCSTTLNLICHSMGNYLLKKALSHSDTGSRELVFDNVVLAAADANNQDHRIWVENMPARRNLYITINENDAALNWSRIKPGKEQLPRLGHYTHGLDALNATYVNVTKASWIRDAHTYFVGRPVVKNDSLHRMFEGMFSGQNVEDLLRYRPEGNYFELK